jgi:hypothetical protein
MKFYLIVLCTILSFSLRSQWLWDYGINLGASNYLGDIGGKEGTGRTFIADLKLAKTRWNIGGFARYKWKDNISLKLAFDYLRIEGDDALSSNPGRRFRNFNFKNDIYDLGFTGEYFFYENNDLGNTYRYRNGFKAYGFIGLGTFFTNPKTNFRGEWIALQPLATEGYKYKRVILNIPMGIGFYFTFNKKHRIGYELNYRKTFSDYLDDISGQYPSEPSDPKEAAIIMRKYELDPALIAANKGVFDSHDWGQKRGERKNKDAYMTMSISYSYVIRGKSSFYRARNSGFFSKKRKMRKVRAKF